MLVVDFGEVPGVGGLSKDQARRRRVGMVGFEGFVGRATGGRGPYGYQSRLAEGGLPDVLCVPTGAGKTLAAVLPWLYRRLEHPEVEVRRLTPRWLVVVLPQRALVEQTVRAVRGWLDALELAVPVHVLMGGADGDEREWKTYPERERIFVGTVDMVLSRLLMRGFAESRTAWPTSFGLLHAGVQFVFDEVQLMGPALPTSLQLHAFREALGTALPCRSMWMSATVDRAALSTVDFRGRELSVVELDERDRVGTLRTRLDATRRVRRCDLGDVDTRRYARALAEKALAEHRPGTRTLLVLNVVDRAVAILEELERLKPDAKLVLLHSRFRSGDRDRLSEQAGEDPGPAGTLVVATQVLEAGVDITSDTLITEVAPWSSIVQRAGRCNRDGSARDARLFWALPPGTKSHLPYDRLELEHTATVLDGLEGQALTGEQLAATTEERTRPVHPVLRRRDLLDLFDTAPDLSGNDIDVGPFIRDADDRTVHIAWRPVTGEPPQTAPSRAELCPAPIGEVRDLLRDRRTIARVFDQGTGEWVRARPEHARPTAVIVFEAAQGGYLPERGFSPRSTVPVEPVPAPERLPDAVDTDPQSVLPQGRWVSLSEHLGDVEEECRELLGVLAPQLTPDQCEAVALAGRYHDLGKAHPTFVASLARADGTAPDAGGPWAKSPGRAPLRHDPPHFRHELVSALLLLDGTTGLLDGVTEPDLVSYLALAHHGKVRVTVRARPDEPEGTVLGVVDGSSTVDVEVPGVGRVPACPVSLHPVRLGQGSLTGRALRLRDRADLGPFRLAFCEALLRGADWRASARYEGDSA